jgi:hypothetical protein
MMILSSRAVPTKGSTPIMFHQREREEKIEKKREDIERGDAPKQPAGRQAEQLGFALLQYHTVGYTTYVGYAQSLRT